MKQLLPAVLLVCVSISGCAAPTYWVNRASLTSGGVDYGRRHKYDEETHIKCAKWSSKRPVIYPLDVLLDLTIKVPFTGKSFATDRFIACMNHEGMVDLVAYCKAKPDKFVCGSFVSRLHGCLKDDKKSSSDHRLCRRTLESIGDVGEPVIVGCPPNIDPLDHLEACRKSKNIDTCMDHEGFVWLGGAHGWTCKQGIVSAEP